MGSQKRRSRLIRGVPHLLDEAFDLILVDQHPMDGVGVTTIALADAHERTLAIDAPSAAPTCLFDSYPT